MIRCGECGQHNEDHDQWCGNCGQFLQYVGEAVTDPGSTAIGTTPPPFVGDLAPAPDQAPHPTPPPPPPPPPPHTNPVQISGPPPSTEQPGYTGIEHEPGPEEQHAERPKKKKPPPKEELRPGDIVCPMCGKGNRPDGNFCRRCGAELAEGTVVPAPSWWSRLFRRAPKPGPVAGDRPESTTRKLNAGRRVRRILSLAGVAVALVAVVGAFGPRDNPIKSAVQDLWSRVRGAVAPELSQVRPIDAVATSSAPEAPAHHVIDGANNTWWSEGVDGLGIGERLTLTFDRPVDIARVGFTIGTTRDNVLFVLQPRPKELFLTFSDGSTHTVMLEDEADFQRFGVSSTGATSVDIHILDVYPSSEGSSTSIAEIEFFAKKR